MSGEKGGENIIIGPPLASLRTPLVPSSVQECWKCKAQVWIADSEKWILEEGGKASCLKCGLEDLKAGGKFGGWARKLTDARKRAN